VVWTDRLTAYDNRQGKCYSVEWVPTGEGQYIARRFGLTTARPNLHMCFTGDLGPGKTTVALRMAGLLKRLG
jgi:hypothetical protein